MKIFSNDSSIPDNALPKGIKIRRMPRLLISFFLSSLLLISGKAFSQSADIDQGENGSKTAPKNIFWQNGNLGPSGAHFAEGYSIPYRMKIAGLTGGTSAVHTLVIEWDTKDQNGHALDYLTHYDNLDNPVGSHQANFGHDKEVVNPLVNPTTGTTYVLADVVEVQIPTPSSTGAEVGGMPGASFLALPGSTNRTNATKMSFWGANTIQLSYSKEDNQDATTASTKSRLTITFKSNNGTTALVAWGGHIAAEYDWGTGRGASKVNGSPYHMRLVSIDTKPGSQDRSLKATAVFVPPPSCAVTATQTVCEGSATTLAYSYTGPTSGITNYSWTLTPGTSGAKIQGSASNTVSGASLSSINIVPVGTGYTVGSFTLALTVTNLGGTAPPCNTGGTVNAAVTTNAGSDQPVCASSPNVTLAGSVSGGASTGTWSGGGGTFAPNNTTLNAVYTPSDAEVTAGTVTLTLTSADPAGECAATTDQVTIAINPAVITNAGPDQPVCATSPAATLAGSVSGGATTGSWSGGGGTFAPNNTALNAVYTPSDAEITAGTVTLTLTSANPDGPCNATTDQVTITINPAATADAGDDQSVCASSPQVTLAGEINGGATGGTWSGGDGIFAPNATTLNATYTPGPGDLAAKTVTLTLTSNDPAGPCGTKSDDVVITITTNPTRPDVEYIAPDCDETTFSIKVKNPVPAGKYTLTQVDGVGTVDKTTPGDLDNGLLIFSGLTIGKGFTIVLKVGTCTSAETNCDNYKTPIVASVTKPVTKSAPTDLTTTSKVTAAPNPFNDKIRFSFTSKVTGRASLDLYNLLGEKVKTVFTGQVQKGQTQIIEYNVPFSQRTTLIYMFRVGNEKVSGKLIGLR
jgi:hypothetical protein